MQGEFLEVELPGLRTRAFFMLMNPAKLLSMEMKLFTNPPAIMKRPVSTHPNTLCYQTVLSLNNLKDEKHGISLGDLLKIKSHPVSPYT